MTVIKERRAAKRARLTTKLIEARLYGVPDQFLTQFRAKPINGSLGKLQEIINGYKPARYTP